MKKLYMQNNSNSVEKQYAYWRFRLTYSLIIGYACYYMVRQNFTFLRTSEKCPFSIESIGFAFSAFSVIYGILKIFAGMVADKISARIFMPIGLLFGAICSLFAGFCDSAILFGVFYSINAIAQSMGWPPVVRILRSWFSSRQLGTRWGVVNASHQIGSIVILICGAWVLENMNWRYLFIIPSCFCIIVSIYLWLSLRDTPESLGLPELKKFEDGAVDFVNEDIKEPKVDDETVRQLMRKYIWFNYKLWIICIANFFVYLIRSGLLCWGPVLVAKTQNCGVMATGCKIAGFEAGGILGGIFAGWITDKFLSEKRGTFGAWLMIALSFLIGIYWYASNNFINILEANLWIDYVFWSVSGFLVYGSQVLTGLSSAEFVPRRCAATAVGITGIFGYAASTLSGIGFVWLANSCGWKSLYIAFLVSSMLSGIFFFLTLKGARK